MADVAPEQRLPGLGEQLRLVMWLRWRGLRNSVHNKNRQLDMIGLLFSGVFSAVLVVGVAVAVFVGTEYLFEQHRESYFALLFLGLFIWWQLFPIMLAGFAPQFSFRSLLRFPFNMTAFYIVGLAYGLADAAAIAAVLWMGAMLCGTAAARSSAVPAMLVACALFTMLNVTIERLLGAWLEKLLAKRRSREVIFTIFILCMISLQFLHPLMQRHGREIEAISSRVMPYLWILPSSFAGNFVMQAGSGEWTGALGQLGGLVVYVAVFSALLWARYHKLYAGEDLGEGAAPLEHVRRDKEEPTDDSETLGFLPPQVLAVFRKELRYLKRNTFLFFSLAFPPVMVFFFSMQFAGVHPGVFRKGMTPDLFFPGMMAYLRCIGGDTMQPCDQDKGGQSGVGSGRSRSIVHRPVPVLRVVLITAV